jgi:hypothetical protein
VLASCINQGSLPEPPKAPAEPYDVQQSAIAGQEVCVGSTISSAGRLADTLYYEYVSMPDGKLAVGYYAFWSEERPWGNNWLTWTLLPALAVDMVYTRAMFVAPGAQRAMYGKGDVEGFRILYDVAPDGTLVVDGAVADNGTHDIVPLEKKDLYAIDPKRPTLYTDVWSHQLGATGAKSPRDLAYVQCYSGDKLRPLPRAVAQDFNVEHRATPAHVERLVPRSPTMVAGDSRLTTKSVFLR